MGPAATTKPPYRRLRIGFVAVLILLGIALLVFRGGEPDTHAMASPFAVKEVDRSSKELTVYAFPQNCGMTRDSYKSAKVDYTPTQVVVHVSVNAPSEFNTCEAYMPNPYFTGTVTLREPIGDRTLVDAATGNPPFDFVKALGLPFDQQNEAGVS